MSKRRRVEKARPVAAPPRPRPRWLLPAGGSLLVVAVAAAVWMLVPRHPVVQFERTADQNVLLITLDTMRADALGCYGGPAYTPNLDRLARDGVRFTFAHAQTVLTLPSHANILTGEYPFQHGIRDNSGYRLKAGTPTLATILRSHGFDTGAFVSAFPLNARFGLNAGFQVYNDSLGETQSPNDFILASRPAGQTVPLAEAWIKQQRGRWFEWLHLFDAHAPYTPPPPFNQEYARDPYYGEVAYEDQELGPFLDYLRSHITRPTLIVVTGDHGEALGQHGEATHGIFAYEPTLHIPLIITQLLPREHEPSRGEVTGVGARHIDILPTILDALKIPVPSDLPGRTLLPAAQREPGAPPRASYFESMSPMLNRGWAPLTGVIVGHYKYIDLPLPELYNLRTDPGEAHNLIDARADAEELRMLKARLREYHAEMPGARRTEDPQVAAELQSLGYVSGSAPRKAHYTAADDPKRLIGLDQEIHQAIDLYEHHHPDQAIEMYLKILARRPMGIAYQHLAFVYYEVGGIPEAIATLRDALAHGIRTPAIQVQLASYLSEVGRLQNAEAILKSVLQASPDNVDALNNLGIASARLGHNADALAIFHKVLTLDPSDSMATENIGSVYLSENRIAEARQAFEQAVQADPRSSRAHSGLGVVQLKLGDTQAAIKSWTQAIALDPNNFDALYDLAAALVRSGDVASARPWVEQFVKTAPPALYADDIRAFSAWLARTQAQS